MKYKGLHLICNSCGCYGHLGRDCKVLSSHGVSVEGIVVDEPKATVARGYMNNGNGSTIQAVSQGIKSEIHNDWLKVTKVRKPKNNKGVKLKMMYD